MANDVTKMTMETLRKCMSEFVNKCMCCFQDDFIDEISDADLIEREVNKLATPEVLDYINNHMKLQFVTDLSIGATDYMALVRQDEIDIGDDITYMARLWDEPVCWLGSHDLSSGQGDLNHGKWLAMFVTADGDFRFAHAYAVRELDHENCVMELVVYTETTDEYYCLTKLRGLIPQEYMLISNHRVDYAPDGWFI